MNQTTTNTQQAKLSSLATQIIKDNVTPELASSATQLVFGEGNPQAEVVFVGEAPGKDEDAQGKPFVGAAGKFLTKMIEQIGLKRSDVYITNIVKYRPPNNRDPQPGELQSFLPYLIKQLAIIKPKLVVTLGRFSMNVFLPGFSISRIHGQPKRKNGQVYLPLYHPAVALYNESMKETLEVDFQKIPKVLDIINSN